MGGDLCDGAGLTPCTIQVPSHLRCHWDSRLPQNDPNLPPILSYRTVSLPAFVVRFTIATKEEKRREIDRRRQKTDHHHTHHDAPPSLRSLPSSRTPSDQPKEDTILYCPSHIMPIVDSNDRIIKSLQGTTGSNKSPVRSLVVQLYLDKIQFRRPRTLDLCVC